MLAKLLDVVLLREAERRASAYSETERELVRAKCAAARERVKAAGELTAPARAPVVASLLRDAVELRLEAAAVDRDESATAELRREAGCDAIARESFDELDRPALEDAIARLKRVEHRLRRASEPRSVTNIRATRYGRVAGAILLVAYLGARAAAAALAPPNIAFHGRVTVSKPAGSDVAALVDGVRHTMHPVYFTGSPPTVEVDLVGLYSIASVRVTNREDAHLDAVLPVTVSLAEQPGAWTVVDVHQTHFRSFTVDCHGQRARFVRIQTAGHDAALNEVEVFGRFVAR